MILTSSIMPRSMLHATSNGLLAVAHISETPNTNKNPSYFRNARGRLPRVTPARARLSGSRGVAARATGNTGATGVTDRAIFGLATPGDACPCFRPPCVLWSIERVGAGGGGGGRGRVRSGRSRAVGGSTGRLSLTLQFRFPSLLVLMF